jgi:hypothetical protein
VFFSPLSCSFFLFIMSVLEMQLALLEEDLSSRKPSSTSQAKGDRKRRRLEAALEKEEKERKERLDRREKNIRLLSSESGVEASKADRKKKQAFEAIQKKKIVKVNLEEAETTLEKTSLFDFGEDEEFLEKKELEPVEMSDEDVDSDDSDGPVKIFRFPDIAD